MIPALLAGALLLPGAMGAWAEDTAPPQERCQDWDITPGDTVTYSGADLTFQLDSSNTCRDETACAWVLSRSLGVLETIEDTLVIWHAPEDPPEACEPEDVTLTATCAWRDTPSRSGSVDIQLRCTAAEMADYQTSEQERISVAGGGCTNPRSSLALVLLPLGLGARRRLRRAP